MGYIGSQTYSEIGGKYGVYTDEDKQAMTAEFFQMTHLWQASRATILSNEQSIKRFIQDLEGLTVIDESKEIYDNFLTAIRQYYAHIQRGESWDEQNKSWLKAATGFQTWLDEPTFIQMGNQRILAGESGRELFAIIPEEYIQPNDGVEPYRYSKPIIPITPIQEGKKQDINININLKVEMPPVTIKIESSPTKGGGGVGIDKNMLKRTFSEAWQGNFEGFKASLTQEIVQELRREIR
jgi:hypothetical protein